GNGRGWHDDESRDGLGVLRLAVATVAILGQARRAMPFEIRAGDVIEHEVRLKTEEIPQPLVQGYFDGALGGDESVQGAVPGLQLLEVNLNTALPRPARHEAPALPITDKIGLQPARQAGLTPRTHQALADQHEG